ncbi:hypothetical protein JYU34_013004 [Plutella xylostella]|uniref:NADH-ubiquinone oxidoreductase 75 kDa subunit, mitochondrial n=1 Tax=Plutella xylostella TaxID=51655 RepID=A0ABQ7QCP1_PLUXY|nr:hypothetical protein JYU34_013004 [Plutella xylostella]
MLGLTRKIFPKCITSSKLQTRATSNKVEEIKITLNGKECSVPRYYTVLQAARSRGVPVPAFCYHERLAVAGNCRMCLVHVEGLAKPQVACQTTVYKDMKIWTNSEVALKAQESVLEFLLAEHPLDCPICDQGGECDLQDLSMKFGNDRSRFTDIHFVGKRAVENKDLGPLVGTEMTRCIHCTRCIRFAGAVCGVEALGSTGRGTDMLVGTYVDKPFLSELSGNVVDLCPVGALTALPYRFKARPWELVRTDSIDVTDATGTNISINHRFNRVLRVLPRENDEINQEWLSDKGRWAIDSLEMQRLVAPMCRIENCLETLDWNSALKLTAKILKYSDPKRIMAVAGPHCNVETLVACKDLVNTLGSELTFIERGMIYTTTKADLRAAYSLNMNMKDIIKADKILLVGTNPRFEAPILNAWIRKAFLENETDIYYVGPKCEYNYDAQHQGTSYNCITNIAKELSKANTPLVFIGISHLEKEYSKKIYTELFEIFANFTNKDWNVIHVIPREASWAGALEAGWQPGGCHEFSHCNPQVVISLGADDFVYKWKPPNNCKIIYIGFQGDRCSELAEVVLPGSAYTETEGVYLNMECRSQEAWPAVSAPRDARRSWKILRALSEYCGATLPYSDSASLHARMADISPNFVNYSKYQDKLFKELIPSFVCKAQEGLDEHFDVELKALEDYYCSCVFSSNSPTMVLLSNLENLAVAEKDEAKCRRELRAARINAIVKQGLGDYIYEPKPLRK